MQILGAEEVVDSGALVVFGPRVIELPAWPAGRVAFWVGPDNRNQDHILEAFQMANKIGAVGEGAEEANIEVVATFFRLEGSVWVYASVPGVIRPGKMLGNCGWVWPLGCHFQEGGNMFHCLLGSQVNLPKNISTETCL